MTQPESIMFAKNEALFHEGDIEDFAYIIIRGSVDIFIKTDEDKKKVAKIGENNILGEMALLDGEPRSATAIASEEVECYKIQKKHIDGIYGKEHSVVRKLFNIQNERIRTANLQIKSLE